MKVAKDTACALGWLAGTTLGSGIAFLLQWQSYDAVWSVAIGGAAGTMIALVYRFFIRRVQWHGTQKNSPQ
ncbi:hypothetical protein ACE41H_11895 [Paenibacillus enshidis]|uniref:Uncharacterized protein n=1 Tax=Paenibacillus enshidis TaxID=1458439 RepID=A0ABV5ATH3_9BACL